MTAFKKSHFIRALLIGASVFAMSPDRAVAQQSAPDQTDTSGLENITVYAQKKSVGEAIQKVPIAEMAVTGASLDDQHIQDLTELGRLMPNVNLQAAGTTPGYPNFNIRGILRSGVSRSTARAAGCPVRPQCFGWRGCFENTLADGLSEGRRGPDDRQCQYSHLQGRRRRADSR
jgi:outer membrane receptor for Fe3+-dicitrate